MCLFIADPRDLRGLFPHFSCSTGLHVSEDEVTVGRGWVGTVKNSGLELNKNPEHLSQRLSLKITNNDSDSPTDTNINAVQMLSEQNKKRKSQKRSKCSRKFSNCYSKSGCNERKKNDKSEYTELKISCIAKTPQTKPRQLAN